MMFDNQKRYCWNCKKNKNDGPIAFFIKVDWSTEEVCPDCWYANSSIKLTNNTGEDLLK